MLQMKLILGSKSKGRQGVLSDMGLEFEVMHPDLDEKEIRFDDPCTLTLALAHAKADALLPRILEPALLLTFDQVVHCNNVILEKPENAEQARTFLRGYAQYPAKTVTAVVAVNTVTKERLNGVDLATVWFRIIPDHVIADIVDSGEPFSQAGGFSVRNPQLQSYINRIEGEIESVIGLPRQLTESLIARLLAYKDLRKTWYKK